jgi:proteasome alpha subunit
MSMPFYVSPEQVMKDRADYARKGIARGKSLVGLEYAGGVAIVAENPSGTLYKISEIYDRIAFAGVGKYSEFELLKIAGVRHADLKGYSYSREDVTARSLANAYAQTLGQVFTHELKPYEVEILVAQVGEREGEPNELFHVFYDGTMMDEHRFTVLGGQAEAIAEILQSDFTDGLDLGAALRLGTRALGAPDGRQLAADQLEVAILDRSRPRRRFRRIEGEELTTLLVEAPQPAGG